MGSWLLLKFRNVLKHTESRGSLTCNQNIKEDIPTALEEGRAGVFSWCVISSFYFPWNVNLGNHSSWLATWRFCVTRQEPELITDIRDFTTPFYEILRRKFSEGQSSQLLQGLTWLETTIQV